MVACHSRMARAAYLSVLILGGMGHREASFCACNCDSSIYIGIHYFNLAFQRFREIKLVHYLECTQQIGIEKLIPFVQKLHMNPQIGSNFTMLY